MWSVAFGSVLVVAVLMDSQGVFGSGELSTILLDLGGIGLPFYSMAVELTKSYTAGLFVWFSADWLLYTLLCLICLSFVRVLRGRGRT